MKLKLLVLKLLGLTGPDVSKILKGFDKTIARLEKARRRLVDESINTDTEINSLRDRQTILTSDIERVDRVTDNFKSLIDGKNG